MSALPIAKFATQLVASVGVSKVISDIIKSNTTVKTTVDAVSVWTGSIVIGSMVTDQAVKHVNAHVDNVANWWKSRETNEPHLKEAS